MNIDFKKIFKIPADYAVSLVKWLAVAVVVGAVGGVLGSVFHISIDYATEIRTAHSWIILFLPLGGLLIAAMYGACEKKGRLDTNRVLEAAEGNESVPLVMTPLIFAATCITHLLGGSAGREGAALQLGGSVGYNIGKFFRLKKSDMSTIVKTGMSAVFSALFGTPLTAAVFALEVTEVGTVRYSAFVPCVVSAVTANAIAKLFGLSGVHFDGIAFDTLTVPVMIKAIVLAVLCALVAMLFCTAIKKCEHFMEKTVQNRYLRAVVGALLIIGISYAVGFFDYNGAGMDVITRAINGNARYEAFILKIILTAITISAGFKGGEIVPAFFIGSTFGCVAGGFLGLNPGFGAAIGFVALFCSVVNCPIASVILSLEVFGAEPILIMAVVCAVSFMMSGNFSLYTSQKIKCSKTA